MQLEPGIHDTGRHYLNSLCLGFADNSVVWSMNPADRSAMHPGRWLASALRDLECASANRVANAAIAQAMQ